MQIRTGSVADADDVLAMLDEAVDWLVGLGRTGQWGTEHWTADPRKVERARALIGEGDLWIAEIDGKSVGAILLNESPMPYVEPLEERELYVRLLITSRAHKGQGIGGELVAQARAEAQRRGIALLRVDCYAGDDQSLVGFYESAGFTRSFPFTVGEWPGMVLEQRVENPHPRPDTSPTNP